MLSGFQNHKLVSAKESELNKHQGMCAGDAGMGAGYETINSKLIKYAYWKSDVSNEYSLQWLLLSNVDCWYYPVYSFPFL